MAKATHIEAAAPLSAHERNLLAVVAAKAELGPRPVVIVPEGAGQTLATVTRMFEQMDAQAKWDRAMRARVRELGA